MKEEQETKSEAEQAYELFTEGWQNKDTIHPKYKEGFLSGYHFYSSLRLEKKLEDDIKKLKHLLKVNREADQIFGFK